MRCGINAHRARFGEHWRGGFWLPECAFAPELEGVLAEEGVRVSCVELTRRLGLGAAEHLQPILGESGLLLAPIDRQTIALVWSEHGYPADGSYRDYHRHTVHHHNPWSNDGEQYDRDRATGIALEHAKDFVARVKQRLRDGEDLPGGGLLVVALDTELLGHWWYEGMTWLGGVVEQCATPGRRAGAPGRGDRAPRTSSDAVQRELGNQHMGDGRRSAHWSGPAVAEMAFAARAGRAAVLAAGAAQPAIARCGSCWRCRQATGRFMVSRELAGPTARERVEGHSARCCGRARAGDGAATRSCAAWPPTSPCSDAAARGRAATRLAAASLPADGRGAWRIRISSAGHPADDGVRGHVAGDDRARPDDALSPTVTPRSTHAP